MPFPSEDVIEKAIGLLENGYVEELPMPDLMGISGVRVHGYTDTYSVYAHRDGLMCDCYAGSDHGWTEPRCSHALAAMVWWAEEQASAGQAVSAAEHQGVQPDWKPRPRVMLSGGEWHRMIGAKDHWTCRLCGKQQHWSGFSAHHLVPRGQGGDDVEENGVYLCGSGTTGCHGEVEGYAPGARARLRLTLSRDERRYITEKKSSDWLARHYPQG